MYFWSNLRSAKSYLSPIKLTGLGLRLLLNGYTATLFHTLLNMYDFVFWALCMFLVCWSITYKWRKGQRGKGDSLHKCPKSSFCFTFWIAYFDAKNNLTFECAILLIMSKFILIWFERKRKINLLLLYDCLLVTHKQFIHIT